MDKGEQRTGQNALLVDLRISTKNDKQASTYGSLVKNKFYLRVKPKVSGCVCGGQPQNSIPINVYNKPLPLSN